ncbi:MAG: helix-turn-helix transcriptional regulator [Gammaproteobacteria bacterium]|jgi:DNA-binding CsgD family transcriptional regulator|nr:helix-turn-helix transcriptional regulator [Gammaproteobacteria bacterium]
MRVKLRARNPVKKATATALSNPVWEELLSISIDAIGGDHFHDHLIFALRKLAPIDHSVVFSYYREEIPLCLAHTYSAKQQVIFVDDYVRGPYLLDPFFKASTRHVTCGLYRLRDIAPDRFYQSEYYRSYYVRTGLAEEICYLFYLPEGPAAVISLMRLQENSRFSAREFRLLEKVSPIVISMARRQWQQVSREFSTAPHSGNLPDDHSLIEKTVGELFSNRITRRESQVIAQVLEGYSSEAIAKSLGIAAGTVRIHRRNIYAKLNISSQQQLFSIFFKKITSVHGTP